MENIEKRIAHYHLPGLFEFYDLYRIFLPLFFKHREYFYDWCDIGSIYGAPGDALWGGGRAGYGESTVAEVISLVNEFNIKPEEKDGKLSSSTKALEMLSIQEGNLPIVKALKKYRKESKVISSFGEKYLLKFLKANNRLHTRFNSVMSTGRISSSNPKIGALEIMKIGWIAGKLNRKICQPAA